MKNILIILVLLIIGCDSNTPFTDIKQAKNEVNKKGFRDGKWVVFLDKNHEITLDTSTYEFYLLSTYDNGIPIGSFKKFYKGGVIRADGKFLNDSNKFDQHSIPQKFYGKIVKYDPNGKINQITECNNRGDVVIQTIYINNDSIVIQNEYYQDNYNLKKSNLICNAEKFLINFFYSHDKLTDDSIVVKSGYPKYKKSIRDVTKIKEESEIKYLFLQEIYSRETALYGFLYLDSITLFDDKGNLLANSDFGKAKKLDLLNSNQTSEGGSQITNSGSKTCTYCGRKFNKNNGYVIGVEILCATTYSHAALTVKVARAMKYDSQTVKRMEWGYQKGRPYCSQKCVFQSGHSLCAE